jgi:ribosome modulation factor
MEISSISLRADWAGGWREIELEVFEDREVGKV